MKILISSAVAILSLASCTSNRIYVPEDYPYKFNANYGDIVFVIMDPVGNVLERCDNMGGELVYNDHTGTYTCEGVDF